MKKLLLFLCLFLLIPFGANAQQCSLQAKTAGSSSNLSSGYDSVASSMGLPSTATTPGDLSTNASLTYDSVASSMGLPQTSAGQVSGVNPYTGTDTYSSPGIIASSYDSVANTMGLPQMNAGQVVGYNYTTGQPLYSSSGISSLGSSAVSGFISSYASMANFMGLPGSSTGQIVATNYTTGMPTYSVPGVSRSSGAVVYSPSSAASTYNTFMPSSGSSAMGNYYAANSVNSNSPYGSNVTSNGSSAMGNYYAASSANSNSPYGNSAASMGSTTKGWNVGNLSGFGLPSGSISGIIKNIPMWLLGIFGFVGVIGFVISGLMYLTAAGDTGQAETAKNAMVYSIIGIIVGLSGLVVIIAVNAMLNGTTF
ncbi:MAG: pilin [Candidatus Pacebacteria bacterium]|nr:pilin [Candidatus Paceibacterota bacterium]